MIRRLFLLAFTLGLACGIGALGSSSSRAAETAQKVARVGFVSTDSPSTATRVVNAFWGRLRELGSVEGQNLVVETRWANDHRTWSTL